MELLQPVSREDLDAVREVFLEYANSLGFDLCFQGFSKEVGGLLAAHLENSTGVSVTFDRLFRSNRDVQACAYLGHPSSGHPHSGFPKDRGSIQGTWIFVT